MFSLLTRPVTPLKPISTPVGPPPEQMAEYLNLCKRLDIETAATKADVLQRTLTKLDFPTYDLKTVVAYMDAIAKRDGDGYGWLWRPVRDNDQHRMRTVKLGTPSSRLGLRVPASDYYDSGNSIKCYRRQIPMHALRRMDAITRSMGDEGIAFMISDYATKDDLTKPDPFLMVVVTTTQEAPRYVIDFWDEPGFGFAEMLR